MLSIFHVKFLICLPLAFVTSALALQCMDCMESRVVIGEFQPLDQTSNCCLDLNTTSCRPGQECFTLRVSHGGLHYGIAITNHLVHRGCKREGEPNACDQLTNHLEPLTMGDVFCTQELCDTELCNVPDVRVGGEVGVEDNVVLDGVSVEEYSGSEEVGVKSDEGREEVKGITENEMNGNIEITKNEKVEKIKEKKLKEKGKKNKKTKTKKTEKNKKRKKKKKKAKRG